MHENHEEKHKCVISSVKFFYFNFFSKIEKRKTSEKDVAESSKPKSTLPTDKQNGSGDRAVTPLEGETSPQSPPATDGQILSLMSDALKLASFVSNVLIYLVSTVQLINKHCSLLQ